MRFTWIDCETGEKDENLFGANGQNDWEKGLGSALTYAERYFLLKFFHIATDADDIDNPNRKPIDVEKPIEKPKDKPIFTMLNFEKARLAKATIEQIESKYQIDEITKQNYLKFINI